jgi:hypothetical protein
MVHRDIPWHGLFRPEVASARGRPALSSVLDEWMPGGSAFWIWLDDGAVQRLIQEGDGAEVVAYVDITLRIF